MITKGKNGLLWVFNEHVEHTVNAMVTFASRKYVRQTWPVPFFLWRWSHRASNWKTPLKGTMPSQHTQWFTQRTSMLFRAVYILITSATRRKSYK